MDFFKYYPKVEFCENEAVNLLVRTRIREAIKKNVAVYSEYTIKDFQRPDIIAENYYGNPKYTWMVFYANDILDPLRDWVMSEAQFNDYINHKYHERIWESRAVYYVGDIIQYYKSHFLLVLLRRLSLSAWSALKSKNRNISSGVI